MSTGYLAECFTCKKLGTCALTEVDKVLSGHVCPLFVQIAEPVVKARSTMMQMYGPIPAVRALLGRPSNFNQEEYSSMSFELPAPGTTYSQRKKEFEIMSFMDVRLLGTKRYQDANGAPVLDWDETLQVNRKEASIEKVLAFELANNIIVPDSAAPQSNPQPTNGAPQMSTPPMPPMPPQPPFQPGMMPPQQPMPQMQPPAPPAMPAMAMPPAPPMAAPQMPPAPPFGMPPAPGMPQMAPPPVATPQQAAGQPVTPPPATTGGKRKKGAGAAAAPPPPPPPAAPQGYAPPGAPPMAAPQGYPAAPQMAMPPAAPPQMAPPMMQPQAPAAPAPTPSMGFDLTPLLQRLDAIGGAVNGAGGSADKGIGELKTIVGELKQLALIQITALHHIYLAQQTLVQSVQGKADVGDAQKFMAYIQQYVPR